MEQEKNHKRFELNINKSIADQINLLRIMTINFTQHISITKEKSSF